MSHPPSALTLAEIAEELHRPVVYLHGLQERFELPVFKGTGYSDAYLAFLRKLVYLRVLSIQEKLLLDLWNLEKKLLQILHADSAGSPTWFPDSCGQTLNPNRRLLLSDYDLGVVLPSGSLQLGLDFEDGKTLPELFAGAEMGEDGLRILGQYLTLYSRLKNDVAGELPLLRSAVKWAGRVK